MSACRLDFPTFMVDLTSMKYSVETTLCSDKAGHISQFPPFLESRFYIDIEMKTEDEWLQDLYAAITRTKRGMVEATENLRVSIHIAGDTPNAAMILFESLFWAEPIGFEISTYAEVKSSVWQIPGL